MISAQLPLAAALSPGELPPAWSQRILPVLQNLRVNLGGWFRTVQAHGPHVPAADHRISHPTGGVSSAFGGTHRPGGRSAYVGHRYDSCTLGTPGAVAGTNGLGLGLIALYGVTALTRSILEPRMVGHQLGLNPLLTLVALYMGYRLWGILGMILAPVLTITVLEIWSMAQPERGN